MPDFLRDYGTTLGPLDVPMTDEQAFALDAVLKGVPPDDRAVRKAALPPQLLELSAGERADMARISTEAIDRDREVVLAADMRDDHVAANPGVTLNHAYWSPSVGRSLWRKRVTEDGHRGVMVKTHYPPRPDGWPAGEP